MVWELVIAAEKEVQMGREEDRGTKVRGAEREEGMKEKERRNSRDPREEYIFPASDVELNVLWNK